MSIKFYEPHSSSDSGFKPISKDNNNPLILMEFV